MQSFANILEGLELGKLKDLMLEQEYEETNALHYADNCILIDKILKQYPDLEKAKALAISLVEHISLKEATKEANMLLFKELAELIEPQSSGPCFEAYLHLKSITDTKITDDLTIIVEDLQKYRERKEWEAGQGP